MELSPLCSTSASPSSRSHGGARGFLYVATLLHLLFFLGRSSLASMGLPPSLATPLRRVGAFLPFPTSEHGLQGGSG
jgi:hypothetical protein